MQAGHAARWSSTHVPLVHVQRVEREQRQQLADLFARQAAHGAPGRRSASSTEPRSFCIARRRRVLIVPSGSPSAVAISTWVIPAQVRQLHGDPLGRGQLAQRPRHRLAPQRAQHVVDRITVADDRFERLLRCAVPLLQPATPQPVDRAVMGDAEQPGDQPATLRRVRVRPLPELEERLLDDLLGRLALGEQLQGEREHRPRMALVQLLEGANIATAESLGERLVGEERAVNGL